ncbi:MAG: FkbM family methyltransferase, partial [Salinivirgaceae bacterium]|nr:FkbM family methyltransferase [Salinivirgaceae bacterium]
KKNAEFNIIKINRNSQLKITVKRDSSDPMVFDQIFLENEYQPIIDFFKDKNVRLLNMIDAGANIGLASIFLYQFYPEMTVLALEPNEKTFHRLKFNLTSNQITSIIPLKIGLWHSDSFLSENHSFRDKMDWSFRLEETHSQKNATIPVRSISSLLNEQNWKTLDFLKIDIEGGEDAVFQSIQTVEEWINKVKVIAIEIHDEFNCRQRIMEILATYNFEIFTVKDLTIAFNKNLI